MQQNSSLEQLFENTQSRKTQKGQILLYQGEKTDDIFYIQNGYVKVYDVTADGDEKLLLILGSGDVFPLVWEFDSIRPLHYFYETITDATFCITKRNTVIKKVGEDHKLALQMLQYFVDRTSNLMSRIECIEATSAKHKVAQVLLYLAESHGDEITNCTYKIRIPVTHQMIADMTGINRSTASVQMKELETEKMFNDSGSIGLIVLADRVENFLEKK